MSPSPNKISPDETEIEGLLSRFKPQPSQRFYQKMKETPWHRKLPDQELPLRVSYKPKRRLLWGLASMIFIFLVIAIMLIPPVRAIARQIIYSFIAAPSNQIEVEVTLASPADLFNYSDPSNFSLSPQAAQSQAGFQVRQISPLPAGLTLVGARYDRDYNAVILLYQGERFTLFLTQRPLGNSQDVFSVGTQAVVEMVDIGNMHGEFVRGGWKAISTESPIGNQTQESQVNITAIWDDALPQFTLRWQEGNVAYELRTLGEGGPSQSDLILWANELK
jgi:hypothetical protein